VSAAASRRWPLFIGLAIAISGALYGALWREGAKAMRRSIEAFAANERASGRDASYSRISVAGFPFVLRGRIEDASIEIADDWRWSGAALFVGAAPWAPDRLTFSAPSQVLDLGELGRWSVEAKDGRATIAGDRNRGWSLRIASGPARVARDGARSAFEAERVRAMIAPDKENHDLTLARIEIADLIAEGATRSVVAPVIDVAVEVADSATAGTEGSSREIRLRRLYAEADGGTILVSGAFHIDAAGYPEGILNAEIANPGVFAAALGELGAVRRDDAETTEASLSLAAIAGGGRIVAPLVLNDGIASIAGVAVAKLPPVD
jgi:hypothetical protein